MEEKVENVLQNCSVGNCENVIQKEFSYINPYYTILTINVLAGKISLHYCSEEHFELFLPCVLASLLAGTCAFSSHPLPTDRGHGEQKEGGGSEALAFIHAFAEISTQSINGSGRLKYWS